MVKFTRLRRDYSGDGIYTLVAAGEIWIPERTYTITSATHTQPGGAVLAYSKIKILDTNEDIEAIETVETVLVRQEAGLEQTRYTNNPTP